MFEQYSVSDLLTWLEDRSLVLNTNFQRRSVWTPIAKTYFIDTILRGRPTHKIYVRTLTDVRTKRSFREVVDGQQRLKTIQEFANGQFALGSRAEEFKGKRYADLDEDDQKEFLSYLVSVEQLFNAGDEEVLDVFHRLNAYGLALNHQELRHGKYQGAFRWSVIEASSRWVVLWERYQVVGLRARVRMADDELMAQLFGVILEGVVDGGQPAMERLYKRYDPGIPPGTVDKLDQTLDYILNNLSEIMETGLSRATHFLMLFAAVAHALFGIPQGDMKDHDMPPRDARALTDVTAAKGNLGLLADALEMDEEEVPERFVPFRNASAGTTQRIRSRRIRFPVLYRALLPDPL
jgi:hypothetical protein